MYRIDVDQPQALIEFILDGSIREEEALRFVEELKAAAASLVGRDIKVLADLRTFRPSSPEVAELIRQVQEFGLRLGVVRAAELVDNPVVALQFSRVARESGMERVLQRFSDELSARRWLIEGDDALLSA